MSMRAEIFEQSTSWQGPLTMSAVLHVVVLALGMLFGWMMGRVENLWGNVGAPSQEQVANVHLVASEIPLPARENDPNSVLATDSVGKSEEQPKPAPPEPDAIPILGKIKKPIVEKPHLKPNYQKPLAVPDVPKDIVPFGRAPAASAPYSVFRAAAGNGGMTFGTNSSFAERYAWYVTGVQHKVSDNWFKYEVDPGLRNAPRVYLTFEISRDGSPSNIQISQSSGIPSLDISAVRALKRIETFGALPGDYSGNKVNVEFWFEFQ